ncbi:MAG: SCO1664 family protein [Actinomycetota bacterium]
MPRDERPLEADHLSDPGVPAALLSGELELLGLLPNSSNYTFLAKATAGEDQVLAVYKPQRGETPLWDFPEGTLCRREVAAYVVARELGWPSIPPTVLRNGPEGLGSVQLFVEFDTSQHYFTLEGTRRDEFRRIALFDVVVNNADRKGGHCLLSPDGTIWVVDHGVCFSDEPKLRTVIWEHAGEPIPRELLAALRRFRDGLANGPVRAELSDLLSVEELTALDARIDAVVRVGVFPEPGPGRPYPWPPV